MDKDKLLTEAKEIIKTAIKLVEGSLLDSNDWQRTTKKWLLELDPPPKFELGQLLLHKPTGRFGILVRYGSGHCVLSYSTDWRDTRYEFLANTNELELVDALMLSKLAQRIADDAKAK